MKGNNSIKMLRGKKKKMTNNNNNTTLFLCRSFLFRPSGSFTFAIKGGLPDYSPVKGPTMKMTSFHIHLGEPFRQNCGIKLS